MTRDEIEQVRVGLKEVFSALAQGGVMLGKPASEIALVVNSSPVLVDKLCDLALSALEVGRVSVPEGWMMVPEDLVTHLHDWHEACSIARQHPKSPDDASYWEHQMNTLENIDLALAQVEYAAHPAPSAADE